MNNDAKPLSAPQSLSLTVEPPATSEHAPCVSHDNSRQADRPAPDTTAPTPALPRPPVLQAEHLALGRVV